MLRVKNEQIASSSIKKRHIYMNFDISHNAFGQWVWRSYSGIVETYTIGIDCQMNFIAYASNSSVRWFCLWQSVLTVLKTKLWQVSLWYVMVKSIVSHLKLNFIPFSWERESINRIIHYFKKWLWFVITRACVYVQILSIEIHCTAADK